MLNKTIFLIQIFIFFLSINCLASVKQPEFGGQFYPAQAKDLSSMVDNLLEKANPSPVSGEIFALIVPHAGYGYSGQTAAFGYKLIKNKNYKTVVIIGTSHHKNLNGAAVFASKAFSTPLGEIKVDDVFAGKLTGKNVELSVDESAFDGEHSIEVQLPFLQRSLKDFKIVPIIVGDCSLDACKRIAVLIKEAIADRKDILVVISSDLYHGYDSEEAATTDALTLDLIKKMDADAFYYSLRDEKAQACGGFAIVIGLILSKEMGHDKAAILQNTNSALLAEKSTKGEWVVGYASIAIDKPKGEEMLNNQQKKKLLEIARASIECYLKNKKKLEVNDSESGLDEKMGAFVTLNMHGQLRGCIGNLIGNQPIYLTVRDMAVEAAVDDPRFPALNLSELKDVNIEISALTPLERIASPESIEIGKHGVLVRSGYQSGVFLPQVATETGWSKEEFLNNLCAHKAGLPADAWKDKNTELYIFSAQVFSEKELAK